MQSLFLKSPAILSDSFLFPSWMNGIGGMSWEKMLRLFAKQMKNHSDNSFERLLQNYYVYLHVYSFA